MRLQEGKEGATILLSFLQIQSEGDRLNGYGNM